MAYKVESGNLDLDRCLLQQEHQIGIACMLGAWGNSTMLLEQMPLILSIVYVTADGAYPSGEKCQDAVHPAGHW